MKRTLVERVARRIYVGRRWKEYPAVHDAWYREARRIIAMVRRHDRKEKGK